MSAATVTRLIVIFFLAALSSASGCRSYKPGSFADHGVPFPGTRTRVGCIDVAVAANQDDVATGTIARFSLANRCDHAAPIDLSGVVARYRDEAGQWQRVQPTDPRGELRPVSLEARSVAVEYLEYSGASPELCFDLTALTNSSAERRHDAAPICFTSRMAEVTR